MAAAVGFPSATPPATAAMRMAPSQECATTVAEPAQVGKWRRTRRAGGTRSSGLSSSRPPASSREIRITQLKLDAQRHIRAAAVAPQEVVTTSTASLLSSDDPSLVCTCDASGDERRHGLPYLAQLVQHALSSTPGLPRRLSTTANLSCLILLAGGTAAANASSIPFTLPASSWTMGRPPFPREPSSSQPPPCRATAGCIAPDDRQRVLTLAAAVPAVPVGVAAQEQSVELDEGGQALDELCCHLYLPLLMIPGPRRRAGKTPRGRGRAARAHVPRVECIGAWLRTHASCPHLRPLVRRRLLLTG